MPFDNPPKSPYLNLPSKSPVPLPPSTPFSTDHFVSCTCSENTRKSVRTASTPHTAFRLDPSFTSLPSQGRSAPPPIQGQPRALPPTPSDLLTDFAGSGGLSAPFLRLPFFPLLRGTKTRVSLQPHEQHPVLRRPHWRSPLLPPSRRSQASRGSGLAPLSPLLSLPLIPSLSPVWLQPLHSGHRSLRGCQSQGTLSCPVLLPGAAS